DRQGPNLSTTNVDSAGLQMSLPAKAENVAVVRHAIAGLAERIGMDDPAIADLKTVVTEACMNVVVHAYPEAETGVLEIEAVPDLDGLTVAVRDFGRGISPRPGVDRPSLRIGLALIAALSSSFEIRGGIERGTEIRMHLPLHSRPIPGDEATARPESPVPDATEIRVGAAELLGPVLSGAAAGLRSSLSLPDVGGSLETLADEVRTEADGDGEYLVVGIAATAS